MQGQMIPPPLPIAAQATVPERTAFIQQTYLHLAGAIGAFIVLEALLLHLPGIENVVRTLAGGKSWLLVLGGFMLVSWIANKWAMSDASVGMQYLGLGLFVVAEAIIFLPLLYVAAFHAGPVVIPAAAGITIALFGGLTATVFITKADFSFLRFALMLGGLAALALVVCSIIFGFQLGIVFSVVMVALAAGFVLYDTSNVLHHYRVGQHVAASLALFASIALMFWYILRLLMSVTSRD